MYQLHHGGGATTKNFKKNKKITEADEERVGPALGTDIRFFSFGVRVASAHFVEPIVSMQTARKGVFEQDRINRRNEFFRCLNLLAVAAADDGAPLQLAGAGDGRLINAVSRTIRFYNK